MPRYFKTFLLADTISLVRVSLLKLVRWDYIIYDGISKRSYLFVIFAQIHVIFYNF